MLHFTRLRFVAGAVALSALAVGCGGPPARQTAQRTLATDLATLQNDAKALPPRTTVQQDLAALSAGLAAEQRDWRAERSGSTCSAVTAREQLVAGDAKAASRDAGNLRGYLNDLTAGNLTILSNDVTNVRSDVSALKALGAAPPAATAAVVAAGSQALQAASDTVTSAGDQADTSGRQAARFLAMAQKWARQHACKAATPR